jgi:hypothetical protein
MYSRFTPTCFSKSSGGCRYLRRYSSDIRIVGVYGLRSVQCGQLLWDVTKGHIHSWLHLTTDHTGWIIVHIHPQYRYCLSSFWSNYNPLMLAVTCWNKMKERPTKCNFKVNHKFRIISCSYMFRHCRSTIFREPKISWWNCAYAMSSVPNKWR